MTTGLETREDEVERLYSRFKTLSLGASAALLLDRPVAGLAVEANTFLAECMRASAAAAEPDAPLVECVAAAWALTALLGRAGGGASTTDELAELRTAHARLRREVWNVLPCEYVPCCAVGTHTHRGE